MWRWARLGAAISPTTRSDLIGQFFFKKKFQGCDCVHEMSCQVLSWALCLSCMFLVVVLVFFIYVAHFECIDKSNLIAQPLYHFPPHINTLLLRNHFCSRQGARFVLSCCGCCFGGFVEFCGCTVAYSSALLWHWSCIDVALSPPCFADDCFVIFLSICTIFDFAVSVLWFFAVLIVPPWRLIYCWHLVFWHVWGRCMK